METEKLPGNVIKWEYKGLNDHEIEEILGYVPDEESYEFLRAKLPGKNVMKNFIEDMEMSKIIWHAVEKSFDTLQEIRENGPATHAAGHAAAYTFKKCLSLFDRKHFHSPRAFRDQLSEAIQRLEKAYEPVFKVLTLNFKTYNARDTIERQFYVYIDFTMSEKRTLLRAQWPSFVKEWHAFSLHDWHNEYKALYRYCLDKYVPTLRELEHPRTDSDLHE